MSFMDEKRQACAQMLQECGNTLKKDRD